MTVLSISLSESLKAFVDRRVAEEGYSTPDDYLQALVRQDQERKAQERLETLLLEGVNSGEPIEVDEEYLTNIRRRVQERLAGR